MDNNTDLNFRKTENGRLSGNIVSDKNKYQNYFLCLKSDTPCQVDIDIDIKEIQPGSFIQQQTQENVQKHQEQFLTKDNPSFLKNWKFIIFIGVLCFGGYYFYTNYYKTTSNVTDSKLSSIKLSAAKSVSSKSSKSSFASSKSSSSVSSVASSISSSDYNKSPSDFFTSKKPDQGLLSRLNKL